jgi:hypothetical protein
MRNDAPPPGPPSPHCGSADAGGPAESNGRPATNELLVTGVDDIGRALEVLKERGGRSITLCSDASPEPAERVAAEARARNVSVSLLPADADPGPTARSCDGVFMAIADPPRLSAALARLAGARNLLVWAPVTRHFFKSRPVFVQSVPKCGTHVLFECLKAFGYAAPTSLDLPDFDAVFDDGVFYNLQHMPASCLAAPYHRIPRLADALSSSVTLFIVRDPRDAAVSLAHYLPAQVDYHIAAALFREMTLDERITRVITGSYPIPIYLNRFLSLRGSIAQLFREYATWWSDLLPNVWRVRFEDIIGPRGGGSAAGQLQAVWGLQLALHVPGRPAEYCHRIFSESALTFRRGRIGDHREDFAPPHHRLFAREAAELSADLGYADSASGEDASTAPRRAPNCRFKGEIAAVAHEKFGGRLARAARTETPAVRLVDETAEYNLLAAGGRWLAVAKSLGPTDMLVETLGERELRPCVLVAQDLDEARRKARAAEAASRRPPAGR